MRDIPHREMIQAWLDGAFVEVRMNEDDLWLLIPESECPSFYGSFKYRVAEFNWRLPTWLPDGERIVYKAEIRNSAGVLHTVFESTSGFIQVRPSLSLGLKNIREIAPHQHHIDDWLNGAEIEYKYQDEWRPFTRFGDYQFRELRRKPVDTGELK